ncbi:hypothetical protein KSS87_020401 [Heliosperma pusillum]|nr:hypothetical protein KSS87_020401 [Heliosperma pusillum]
MNSTKRIISRPLSNLFTRSQILNSFCTALNLASHYPPSPVKPADLLRVCTILYQQQNAPIAKLETHLLKTELSYNREFFLQVCNKFPYSWRPVYHFYKFTLNQPGFTHTPVTLNKMLDVICKARNIDLLWQVLLEMTEQKIANDKTFRIALKTLAAARELKKCVECFHVMNSHGHSYSLGTLNKIVETLCKEKLVDEAKHIVMKLKDSIKPDGVTYGHLICGFCDVGEMIKASKIWNLMTDEGFEADVNVINTMMERIFKDNEFSQGLRLFQTMRVKRMEELGLSTYSIVIGWMCKRGKLTQACVVFEEMQKREIQADNATLASIIYGLVCKNQLREAYLMVENIHKPEISVYHGLIKGLLKLRKVSEAAEVFREMIRKGCEPIMHTYIMLLQGHMGKRGRKGNDPLVNFDSIFVGGMVKAGKSLEATKYSERALKRGLEVPRFDYNKFLQLHSNEEGVVMFEEVGKKLREFGLFDLADIFVRYGEKMATRDRRRSRDALEELPMA